MTHYSGLPAGVEMGSGVVIQTVGGQALQGVQRLPVLSGTRIPFASLFTELLKGRTVEAIAKEWGVEVELLARPLRSIASDWMRVHQSIRFYGFDEVRAAIPEELREAVEWISGGSIVVTSLVPDEEMWIYGDPFNAPLDPKCQPQVAPSIKLKTKFKRKKPKKPK